MVQHQCFQLICDLPPSLSDKEEILFAHHAMVGVPTAQLAGSEPPPPEAPSATAPLSHLHLQWEESIRQGDSMILCVYLLILLIVAGLVVH